MNLSEGNASSERHWGGKEMASEFAGGFQDGFSHLPGQDLCMLLMSLHIASFRQQAQGMHGFLGQPPNTAVELVLLGLCC